MREYLAWVLFLVAAVNLPRFMYQNALVVSGEPGLLYAAIYNPTPETIAVALIAFSQLLLLSLCLYLWYRWK